MTFDFHTHNSCAVPGTAIVNLPIDVVAAPSRFSPVDGALYSAGIHPWWTDAGEEKISGFIGNLDALLRHPQVVRVGECGLDKLRGASLDRQIEIFRQQIVLSEALQKPVTIHCVKAYDVLLRLHKEWRVTQNWTVHGFRGRPALALQLLDAGIDLSFGSKYDPQSWQLTPPGRRHLESDEGQLPEPSDNIDLNNK